jgi:glycosyltransferase involved in cell wall biosynthesis
VGAGPDRARLEARFGDSAEFLGRIDDAELAVRLREAAALVLPNVEEFGIAAVEAQASGRPVVAAGAGGALETVIDGETGIHFTPDDPDSLAEALREVDFHSFSPERVAAHAQNFSVEHFQRQFAAVVDRVHGQTTSAASRDLQAAHT